MPEEEHLKDGARCNSQTNVSLEKRKALENIASSVKLISSLTTLKLKVVL